MLINPSSYGLFLATGLVLCIVPGPDMLYIVNEGVSRGTRAALLASLGMATGMLWHTATVVLGLAALVRSSPLAYHLLQYAGCGYLIFLAWHALRDPPKAPSPGLDNRPPVTAVFRQAAITNILNPKILLFYLALLPQFVKTSVGHPVIQTLILGLTFVVLGLVVDTGIALLAGRVGVWLRAKDAARWLSRTSALVFLGLAARMALS